MKANADIEQRLLAGQTGQEIADALGLHIRTVRHKIAEARRKHGGQWGRTPSDRHRAATDWTAHEAEVPVGYHVRGTSTMRNAKGEAILTWEKTARDQDAKIALMVERITTALDSIDPLPPSRAPDIAWPEHLLSVYPIGDVHLGMYAHALETGQDFDVKIAGAMLREGIDQVISLSPPSETAIICPLGDFFHADNAENRTSRSGHALDVDTRWGNVFGIGIDLMIWAIRRALEKHRRVIVRIEIGNHDDLTSQALAHCLAHAFADDDRVEVSTSPCKFWYHRHGQCLIGTTHTDTVKADRLSGVMATDCREDWGATTHRKWYAGHRHKLEVIELPGCVVQTYRSPSPRDAYAHAAGYRSGRDLCVEVWHNERGLITRHIVGTGQ